MTPPYRLRSVSTFSSQQTLLHYSTNQKPTGYQPLAGVRDIVFLDKNGNGRLGVNTDRRLDYSEIRPKKIPQVCSFYDSPYDPFSPRSH